MDAQDDGAMFDEATRERIRRKLLTYMKGGGIGAPRLAIMIKKSTPRGPEIPIKTLQRFLKGKIRTNDMYVGFFQDFVAGLPDPDPIGELGRAMAAFHSSEAPVHFAGEYTSYMSCDSGPDRRAYSSDMSITADDTFCRVIERSNNGRLVVRDGALVTRKKMAVIVLQDRMTRAPRQYLIGADRGGYEARGTEAVFGSDADTVHSLSGRVSARENEHEGPAGFMLPPSPSRAAGLAVSRPRMPVPSPAFTVGPVTRPGLPPKEEVKLTVLGRLFSIFKSRRNEPQQPPPPPRIAKETTDGDPLEELRRMVPESRAVKMSDQLQTGFLMAAERADEAQVRKLVEAGVDINQMDPETGLTALHLSVGRDAIGLVRYLVGLGAKFIPDRYGRMPSTIAAECEVSDEVSDFILDAEAAAEGV